MGCDIFCRAERREDGEWVTIPGLHPFAGWRSYNVFAFLAGVRNYSAIEPISPPRDLPQGVIAPPDTDETPEEDFLGVHSFSWLLISELLAVDYDRIVEDRRAWARVDGIWYGSATAPTGDGISMPLRQFLSEEYFDNLDALVAAGAERIIFGFQD